MDCPQGKAAGDSRLLLSAAAALGVAPWRIKRVRKFVDHVLCGLSFSSNGDAERGVSAEYVGHPFFDEIQEHTVDQSFVEEWATTGN